MKMSIVTGAKGEILAAVQGHGLSEKRDGIEASVSFGGNHQIHEVDVEDDLATITDAVQFQQRLLKHLPRH
jgi:hypothetical protein